jgi:cytochrome c553
MNKLYLSALLAAGVLIAAPTYAGGDAAAGKTIAENSCADCHGDDGKGDDENPALAGMAVDKFTKAITEYQNGTRTKDAKMTKAAKKLSPADVANVAAYYAGLKK